MLTSWCSCLSPIENGCETMANSLLVPMPNKQAPTALSILQQGRKLTPDGTEVGALKHVVLIANSLSAAKIAPAKVAWKARPGRPALLHRQSMRTNPELNQCPEPGDAHGQLIVRLTMTFARAANPNDDMCIAWPPRKEQSWETHASLPTPSTGLEPSCSTSHGCPKPQCQREQRERPGLD